MFRVGIITASDKGAAGQREDRSGPVIRELLEATGQYRVTRYLVLPDEREQLRDTMAAWCDGGEVELILTTGGDPGGGPAFPPGISPRRPPPMSASVWSPVSPRPCGPPA